MAQKRIGRPRTDPDIVAAVKDLARKEWSGPKITEKIAADERFADRAPSLKTVQNIMRDARMPEIRADAEAWTVATAPADEAEYVLPALGCLIDRTGGAATRIRRDHAAWVARIGAALPALDPWRIYIEAGEYAKAIEREEPTASLDRRLAELAWQPYAEAEEAQGEAFARGRLVGEPPLTTAMLRGFERVPPGDRVVEAGAFLETAQRTLKDENDG
ncbi:MAG: hypothetical protein M3R49_03645 [Chloroflexota bacterium]|nr:hypothetical protein [Chloroflexota bacterium]